MGKIFGIALVFVVIGSMLGGLLATLPFAGFGDETQAMAQESGVLSQESYLSLGSRLATGDSGLTTADSGLMTADFTKIQDATR